MGTDLSAGTSFELDDVDKGAGTAPTEFAMPSTTTRAGRRPCRWRRDRRRRCAVARRPRRRSGFWLGVIFALAAVIGIRYAKNWAEQKGVVGTLGLGGDASDKRPAARPPAPGRHRTPPPAPAAATPPAADGRRAAPAPAPAPGADAAGARRRPRPSAGRPCAGRARRRAPEIAAPIRPTTRPAARRGRATRRTTTTSPTRRRCCATPCPNAEDAVIGEEEAEAPPPSRARPAPKHARAGAASRSAPPPKTAASASRRRAPAKVETAVLHITSAPAGAIVRTKYRVLGRTPINLHFRTGNTYELSWSRAATSRRPARWP